MVWLQWDGCRKRLDIRQRIEPVEERHRVFESFALVSPSKARLRSFREHGAGVDERHGRRLWDGGPALIEERHTARREARHPDRLERFRSVLRHTAHAGDRDEFVVDDVEEIAWRKTIRRVEDVGLAPADELLADVHCEGAVSERGRQPPKGQPRTLDSAVAHVEPPAVLDLVVRVGSQIDAARELHPGRGFDEHFLACEEVAHRLRRIVGSFLREEIEAAVQEPALRHRLGVSRRRAARTHHQARDESGKASRHAVYWRRIACSVKSSSFSATLYSSLSRVSRVRLPRRTSVISICLAVQMP